MTVFRDTDWRLRANEDGHPDSYFNNPARKSLPSGKVIPSIPQLEASTSAGAKLVLRDVDVVGEEGDAIFGSLHRKLCAQKGQITPVHPGSVIAAASTCRIWCLNGPRQDFQFTTWTQRDGTGRNERKRNEVISWPQDLLSKGMTRDAFAVPAPRFGVVGPTVLARVPKDVGIQDSLHACVIEFMLPDPPISPSWDEVDEYLCGLSFVLGARLIPLGYTLFDAAERPLVHELRSGWRVSDCGLSALPPVAPGEPAFSELVPPFLMGLEDFDLKAAMRLVWLAESMPREAALPVYGAALECVVNAWFKSSKSKSGGKHMQDTEWKGLSEEPMKQLADALGKGEIAERILRRARSVNNFGANEKFEQFFSEVELKIDNVERAAMKARNRPAHGGGYSPAQCQPLVDTIAAYRTLVGRVILQMLGWTGNYVDYSTYGWPDRPLGDPLGGPNGDRAAAKL